MKKWKVIISFVLVFALLGLAYFFIKNYDPAENLPVNTPSPAITLLSADVTGIMQLDIRNTKGSYGFVRDEENNWYVKNEPEITVYKARVESLCYSAATLSATAKITDAATELANYGLNKPQATVTLTTEKETKVFHIGNLSPAGDGYYMCMDGDKAVYLLSTAVGSQFCDPLSAFRDMTVTAMLANDIRSVSIEKDGTNLKVRYTAPPDGAYPGAVSTWFIESPMQKDADNKLVQELLLTPLSSIVATDIAADNPEDLSPFGFTGDAVEIESETEKIRFLVGTKDGNSYIMPEGKKVVYFMGSGILPFMEVEAFDILEKMTNLISLDVVETIDIKIADLAVALKVVHEGENMQFFVNDKIAAEDAFKDIYIEIAALSVDGVLPSETSVEGNTPEASILYTLTDGSTTAILYYPYDSLNYAVSENSECAFFMQKTKLSILAEHLRTFLNMQ